MQIVADLQREFVGAGLDLQREHVRAVAEVHPARALRNDLAGRQAAGVDTDMVMAHVGARLVGLRIESLRNGGDHGVLRAELELDVVIARHLIAVQRRYEEDPRRSARRRRLFGHRLFRHLGLGFHAATAAAAEDRECRHQDQAGQDFPVHAQQFGSHRYTRSFIGRSCAGCSLEHAALVRRHHACGGLHRGFPASRPRRWWRSPAR